MNFYNFFTNFNVAPETIGTTHPIHKISKLLIDDDGTYYSSSSSHMDWSGNLLEHFASPDFIRTLNPTLFKVDEERTLPIVNFLIRNAATRSILNQNIPMISFLDQLNPTTINRYANGFDEVTRNAYRKIFQISNSYNPTSLFDGNNNRPNQEFLTTLKEFENTHKISKAYSLNKEVHKNFLEDGYVCWVDSVQESLHLNDSELVTPIISLAKYYIATFEHILKIKDGTLEQPEGQPESLGLKIWNKLLQIDNNQNFAHMDFERPTQTLLLLEKEEIQNYIDMFLSLKVFNYLKMNTLVEMDANSESEEDTTTIYSHFSSDFFNKFRENIKNPEEIDNNNLQILQTPPMCMQLAPSWSREYQWEFASLFDNSNQHGGAVNILPPQDNNRKYIPIGGTSGILAHNSIKYQDHKFYNLNVIDSINQNPNKRITGLILNRFTKANNNKQPIEFVSLTKKQSLIRKGFFIPVLVKMLVCNKDCEIEFAYNFSLLNHSDTLYQIKKRRRSRMELKTFYKNYGENGLRIVNYEDFLKKQAEAMKDLSEYSVVNSSTFAEFTTEDIATMIDQLAKTKNSIEKRINYAVTEFSDNITSTLIVNPAVVKKYSKVNNSYTKLIDQNDQAKQLFAESAQALSLTQQSISHAFTQINAYKARIEEYKEQFLESSEYVRINFNKRVDLVKTLCTNKGLYLKVNQRYKDAVAKALKENNYASNNFFKNLYNNEAIKILSIIANNDSDCIQANQSAETLEAFSSMIVSKERDFAIQEVEFLIDKPVKISVDAGKKGEIAGGPYLIKVSKNRVEIALAYPSSIHGIKDSYLYVHPHAGSINLSGFITYFNNQNRIRYSNGCLGEASALLYKAFEKNDLKTIIISALTWVRNANSADPWGRNYKYFPSYAEMIKGKPSLTNQDEEVLESEITEDEVEDFITTMMEETVEEHIEVPAQNEENIEVTQPQQEQTNVQRAVGIENFNTDEAYIPYAQR